MRFGVTSYLFALTGVLILVFEFLMTKYGVRGYHAASIIIALSFIAKYNFQYSSLGAQVVKPIGAGKQHCKLDIWQNYSYVALTLSWLILVGVIAVI